MTKVALPLAVQRNLQGMMPPEAANREIVEFFSSLEATE